MQKDAWYIYDEYFNSIEIVDHKQIVIAYSKIKVDNKHLKKREKIFSSLALRLRST